MFVVPNNKEATMLHEIETQKLKHNEKYLLFILSHISLKIINSLCSVEIYSQYTCITKTIMLRNSFDQGS